MFDPQVDMKTRITSSSHQRLPTICCDVNMSLGVTVHPGQTEVGQIDLLSMCSTADEEALGSDIAVNVRLGVVVFDSRNELIGEEYDSIQRKFAVAILK